jgi:plastocyanin
MRRSTLVTLIIAIFLIIIGVSLWLTRGNKPAATTPTPSASSSPTASASPTTNAAASNSPAASPSSLVMDYGTSGFAPAVITVKSGGSITFKNSSNTDIQVDSNPHPVHTDNPELNIGVISPGGSKSATLTRTGTWTIHNHLDPSRQATVVVQ